jgi:hypothetical protein
MSRVDAWYMVRRRAVDAGVKMTIGNHSFRAIGITDYMENVGQPLPRVGARYASHICQLCKVCKVNARVSVEDAVEDILSTEHCQLVVFVRLHLSLSKCGNSTSNFSSMAAMTIGRRTERRLSIVSSPTSVNAVNLSRDTGDKAPPPTGVECSQGLGDGTMSKPYPDVTKEVTEGTLYRSIYIKRVLEHDTDFVVDEEERLQKRTAGWPVETIHLPPMRFPSYKEAAGEADRCFEKSLARGFIRVDQSF